VLEYLHILPHYYDDSATMRIEYQSAYYLLETLVSGVREKNERKLA
jgi:hypothetical protein